MEMAYVKVYQDWTKATAKLKDAEKGRLIDAMVAYATTGEDVSADLSGNEQYLFPMFQAQIDRDRQALEDYSKKQSANGSKGGRPRKNPPFFSETQQNPKNPPFFSETQKSHNKEKDYEDIPPISPKGERFTAFWKAYPRKVGKGAAEKAFSKLKVTDSMLEAMLEAIAAQKQSTQWRRDGGQYIPHPATWLNQRRWEDETDEAPFEPESYDDFVPEPVGSWESMYG